MTIGAEYPGCNCSRGVGVGVSGGNRAAEQQKLQSGPRMDSRALPWRWLTVRKFVQLLKTPNP